MTYDHELLWALTRAKVEKHCTNLYEPRILFFCDCFPGALLLQRGRMYYDLDLHDGRFVSTHSQIANYADRVTHVMVKAHDYMRAFSSLEKYAEWLNAEGE